MVSDGVLVIPNHNLHYSVSAGSAAEGGGRRDGGRISPSPLGAVCLAAICAEIWE